MSQDALGLANKVINTIDMVLGYWDRELRCQFANTACATWFGRSPHDISLNELLGPLYELSLPYIRGALKGEAQAFECDIMLPDGSIRHSLASYYPDIVDGTVRGFSVHLVNITKTKRLEFALENCNRRARLLASHDFLTGLPNRYLLIDRISDLILNAESSGELVGVVSMDIDGFNAINETYGHNAGDAIIKEVARRMKNTIHLGETVVRISGDEFLFLTTGIRAALEVNAATDRLLKTVQRPLQFAQMSVTPTLNYGIAIYPLNGSNPSELLKKADRARRHAKRFDRGHRSDI
jgi:diguanylate cyclase (GGDEF)-like protein